MGGLFDPGEEKTESQTEATSKVLIPEFLKSAVKSLPQRAEDLSLRPYQPFTGDRFAGFTPDQLEAFSGVRDLQGQTNPLLQSASDIALGLSEGVTGDDIRSFMSPFMQDVVDVEKREALRDFDVQMNEIDDLARRTGAFGGDRTAILESEARRDIRESLEDIQRTGLQRAFDRALPAAFQQENLLANIANLQMGQAGEDQRQRLQQLAALENIGATQQALGQAGLDFDYSQFLEERRHPYQNIQFLSDIALPTLNLTRGQESEQSSVQTVQPSSPSPFSQIAGAVIAGASMGMGMPGMGAGTAGPSFGAVSGNVNSSLAGIPGLERGPPGLFYSKGGKVEKYQEGGLLELLANVDRFFESRYKRPDESTTIGEYLKNEPYNFMLSAARDPFRRLAGLKEKIGQAKEFLGKTPKEAFPSADVEEFLRSPDAFGKSPEELERAFKERDTLKGALKSKDPSIQGLRRAMNEISGIAGVDLEPEPVKEVVEMAQGKRKPEAKDKQAREAFLRRLDRPEPEPESEPERKIKINAPLLAMAGRILNSPGETFGQAVGGGIESYLQTKAGQTKAQIEKQERQIENELARARLKSYQTQNLTAARRLALEEQMAPFKQAKIIAEIKNKGNEEWQDTIDNLLETDPRLGSNPEQLVKQAKTIHAIKQSVGAANTAGLEEITGGKAKPINMQQARELASKGRLERSGDEYYAVDESGNRVKVSIQ